MNKILIIDDDRELCALIKRSVQAENIEADFCNTGKEGLQKLREQEYQLVVLDVMMPGMDGFETLEEIRKENSLPILMFTSKNDSISKVRGLRAGADDYLTKPFAMEELLARIRSLSRRVDSSLNDNSLKFSDISLNLQTYELSGRDGSLSLGLKEFSIMEYLLNNPNKVISKELLIEKIWGYDSDAEYNNVEVYISFLRKKLRHIHSATSIKTVRGVGYRLEES